jgi:hypothetical protein
VPQLDGEFVGPLDREHGPGGAEVGGRYQVADLVHGCGDVGKCFAARVVLGTPDLSSLYLQEVRKLGVDNNTSSTFTSGLVTGNILLPPPAAKPLPKSPPPEPQKTKASINTSRD